MFGSMISYALGLGYYLWLFFILFLAYVTFLDAEARGTLNTATRWLCRAAIFPGWAIDVLTNWTLMSLILWERPKWKEWTVTARASRHCHYGEGRQHQVGKAICQFLNRFQRGGHCKP
jgi:hypothetical protein